MSGPAEYATAASSDGDVDALVAAHYSLRLMGYSIEEGAAGTAEVEIVDGATAAGGVLVVGPVRLAANGYGDSWFGPGGIAVPNGISVNRVSGTTTVTVYYRKD